MIYFIGTSEKIKIGYAVNSLNRLNEMKRDNPENLILYLSLPGTRIDENHFHQKFLQYHIRNEWFENRDILKKFIDEQNSMPIQISKIKRKKHSTKLGLLRTYEGYSLQMIADKLGIKPPSIWERELKFEEDLISIKSLKEYCNVLNYDVEINFKKRIL